MPYGDGTGPGGYGPMTGRAAGFCGGGSAPGYANPAPGRGFWGRGAGGRGWRNWYRATGLPGWQRQGGYYAARGGVWPYAAPAAPPLERQQELEALKGQAEYLERTLADIHRRLDELQAKETVD